MEHLKVLITVKTYPIPSSRYDELVCTAGVTEEGDFVRLYPVNFRDLPFGQQYRKYQWLEVDVTKHRGRDSRKESYRPACESIRLIGEPIPANNDWKARAQYALAKKSQSMEGLYRQQKADRTSLGVFKPRNVVDLVVSNAAGTWKPAFEAALRQQRLWENRTASREPPRKVPYKFQYQFECDDERCKRNHRMMIEDWEVGALYWRCIDEGANPLEAVGKVKQKFLDQICGSDRDTHFFVGTILAHPRSWVVIGVFWPQRSIGKSVSDSSKTLFDL